MSHTLTVNSPISNTKRIISQATIWLLMAALACVLSIVLHEVAHYLTAKLVGAADVTFHWAYVDHDSTSVSSLGNALIALLGPLSSYAMAITAWYITRERVSAFAVAFGFSAAFRNLAVLPFTIKALLGLDTSTFFFDEIRGAEALGVSPFPFVVLSLAVGILGVTYFARKTRHTQNTLLMLVMIAGVFFGVFAWSMIGPMVFPGGHGIN